jgi:hypothetical protein
VCVASDGTLWFTDPSYGHLQGFRPPPETADRVYSHDPATGRTTAVVDGFDKPNGVALSPDERTLYVGDNGVGRLYAIDRRSGARRVLTTFSGDHPDGLKVASDGRILASSVEGIAVLSPDGRLLDRIALAGAVNFVIDGARVLITADTAVWEAAIPAGTVDTAPRSSAERRPFQRSVVDRTGQIEVERRAEPVRDLVAAHRRKRLDGDHEPGEDHAEELRCEQAGAHIGPIAVHRTRELDQLTADHPAHDLGDRRLTGGRSDPGEQGFASGVVLQPEHQQARQSQARTR